MGPPRFGSYRSSDAKVRLEASHALALPFPHARAARKLVVREIEIGPVYSVESGVGFDGGCAPSAISNRIGHLSMASIWTRAVPRNRPPSAEVRQSEVSLTAQLTRTSRYRFQRLELCMSGYERW